MEITVIATIIDAPRMVPKGLVKWIGRVGNRSSIIKIGRILRKVLQIEETC